MAQKRTRRWFLVTTAGMTVSAVGMLAACTPAASPTPSQPAAPPTAAPKAAATAAPATSPAAQAKPTTAPATQAPAKQTFARASLRGITIEGFPDNVWWRMGREMGFFDEFGIDINVEGVNGGNQVIAALVGGEVDFADQSPSTMLTVAAQDSSVKSIGGSRPGLTYVVAAQSHINSLKDIEGKSMGIGAARALVDQISRFMLKKHGVDAEKVTFASVGGTSAIYLAVVAGKIDAGLSDIAALAIAERDGVKILANVWQEIPGFLRGAFWVTNANIQQKGELYSRMMAAYAKTYRYATSPESKDLFVKIAKEDFGVDDDQAVFQWEFIQQNPDTLARNLELSPDGIRQAQELNVEVGNQTSVLPYEQVTDLSLQKRALELVGGTV